MKKSYLMQMLLKAAFEAYGTGDRRQARKNLEAIAKQKGHESLEGFYYLRGLLALEEAEKILPNKEAKAYFSKARFDFERILQKTPDNPALLFGLGRIYTHFEQWHLAFDFIEKAVKLSPYYLFFSLWFAQKLMGRQETEGIAEFLETSLRPFLSKDEKACVALAEGQKIIFLDLVGLLSEVYQKQEKEDQAQTLLNHILQNPHFVGSTEEEKKKYTLLQAKVASFLIKQKEWKKAQILLEKILETDANPYYTYIFALCLTKNGALSQALSLWKILWEEKAKDLEFLPKVSAPNLLLEYAEALFLYDNTEGLTLFRQLVVKYPDFAPGWFALGEKCLKLSEKEEGKQALEVYLTFDCEDSMGASLLLAGMAQKKQDLQPTKASEDYVTKLFDEYAGRFDQTLTQKLAYKAPALLRNLWQNNDERFCNPQLLDGMTLLDLGCGTGLVAEAFQDFAFVMDGVDLSSKMLKKAEQKKLYRHLKQSDIFTYMQASCEAAYDVIIAADVFVYIGDLENIFMESQRLLKVDGVFLFSVEASDRVGQSFYVGHTRRFKHAEAYLQSLLNKAGFSFFVIEKAITRLDEGQPVSSLIVLAGRKTSHV